MVEGVRSPETGPGRTCRVLEYFRFRRGSRSRVFSRDKCPFTCSPNRPSFPARKTIELSSFRCHYHCTSAEKRSPLESCIQSIATGFPPSTGCAQFFIRPSFFQKNIDKDIEEYKIQASNFELNKMPQKSGFSYNFYLFSKSFFFIQN